VIEGKPANAIIMPAAILFAQIESQAPKLQDPIAFDHALWINRLHHEVSFSYRV
jgi:hypothetical protein